MPSTPINPLVAFLARPLMSSYPAATIMPFQLYLQAALSSLPIPSTFLLSANSAPPPQIHGACIASGIKWDDFIGLLAGRNDLLLFISTASLDVQIGDALRTSLWVAPKPADSDETYIPVSKRRSPAFSPTGTAFRARLRETMAAARARRSALLVPTINATPSSPVDDMSDSESDSDVSDSGFSFTSASSSHSSTSASSVEDECISTTPVVDRTKTDVARYMYQGGVTQVMSGGVMLGGSARSPPTKRPYPSPKKPFSTPQNVRKTNTSAIDNWRKSA
ncbi:hypothetical protein B0H10DRAFT_1985436 [Mycena sp. CBHHK59/15]|nr:hypothetical protein B0H10DRAFT_1985436 [Mycena sp. CBHHK59/15]